ncbi:hypothetical protein [Streptomyces sp. SID8352]|uniref:hypothetical protein n=1 Tax=Streptomyces sp. SID8352 TaxID=2690338 RepID=UPI00136972AB|nr:hypothetical protein [Streptomyces sp. SID8352]MYU25977.1 hypothetical protein [Streptomyces sp. SID8352]
MITSSRTGGAVRRLRTGFVSTQLARAHGRRDAAGLLDVLGEAPDAGDPSGTAGLPPYVLGVRARAEHDTTRLRARMLHGNRALTVRIHAESVRVVTQYTVRGEPAPAALARYAGTVADWRNAAAVCRSRAQGVIDAANHLLTCYWDAVWAEARRSHELPDRRPTGWLPGRTRLDTTWHRVDDGLLSDRWYGGRGPAGEPDPAAVAQALAILDSQHTRGGAGRTTGGRG